MSRRPLGANLSPADRLVAYELRIRAYRAAVARLELAMETLHTGYTAEHGQPVTVGHAQAGVWRAFVVLQELNAAPIRRRETVTADPAPAEPAG